MQDGLGFTLTSEDGSLSVEYVFQPETAIHTVSFDAGDGSPVETQHVTDGLPVTEPEAPVREGYRFDGWLLDGQPYDFSTPVTGNITLDAAWKQIAALDELAGVTATVDGTPVEDFDPTGDGEYRIDEGAKVELTGVPEGWTVIRQETANGFTFTLTNGARTVVYTFATATQEEPDTPDEPDEETPATTDPDDTGTVSAGESNGAPAADDTGEMAETGSAVRPAVMGVFLTAMCGIALRIGRRLRSRKMPATARNDDGSAGV